MEYLLIGVGGTGARVLEAFTYLSAAGVLGNNIPKIHMRMVDMDPQNGNLKRLEKTLEHYEGAYAQLNDALDGQESLFRTKDAQSETERIWQPRKIHYKTKNNPFAWRVGVEGNDTTTLNDKFKKYGGNASWLNALFSERDRERELGEGCRARPCIGALEFTKRFMDDIANPNDSFWMGLFDNDLATATARGELRVMFVGSAFGGSGASGMPNLAKLLHQKLGDKGKILCPESNKVGITLMMPFFRFTDTATGKDDAKSSEFLINTKAALLYYEQSGILDDLSAIYLIGGKMRNMKDVDGNQVNESPGNLSQCNPAMPELLVASLAVLDFFMAGDARLASNQKRMIVAETTDKPDSLPCEWEAYPYDKELERGLYRLQRLALLWRLVKTTVEDNSHENRGTWEQLHQKYRKNRHDVSSFDRGIFLSDAKALTDFLHGDENLQPQNEDSVLMLGVLGFLKELAQNGMDDEKSTLLNIEEEIVRIDKVRGLKEDVMPHAEKHVRKVPIYTLVKSLKDMEHINRHDEGSDRRKAFIKRVAQVSCWDFKEKKYTDE